MRLVDRYLLREMVGPAAAALAAFVVLITGHVLFTVVDVVAGKGVRLESIARFAALKAPDAAILALPVATLLGCSLALNRLASDNELVPLHAGGVSGFRLMKPAIWLGIAATLLSFSLKEFMVPWADQEAQKLYRSMLLRQKTLAFKPQTFIDTTGKWVFIAREVDQDTDTLEGLRAFMRQPGQLPWLISAPRAHFRGRRLIAPQVRFYGLTLPSTLDSGIANLDLDLGELSGQVFSGETMQNRSLRKLLQQRAERLGGGPEAVREYDQEIHGRLSLMVACLVFAILSAPIALRFGRGQSLAGVLATLVIAFVYFVVMLGLKLLGGNGALPIAVAAWLQNVALIVLALWAMKHL